MKHESVLLSLPPVRGAPSGRRPGVRLVIALCGLGLLAGCASPPGQAVLVPSPGPQKSQRQFARDAQACRAQSTAIPPGAVVSQADISAAYVQCMAARGNTISALPVQPPPQPAYVYPSYGYYGVGAYPAVYSGWGWSRGWGWGVGVGSGWGWP